MQENIELIKKRYHECKGSNLNETQTRYTLIDPFIVSVLGYDVRNNNEVKPEYSTGFGEKKDFAVDYAIFRDGKPIMLIEAKKLNSKLSIANESQLMFYFN